MATQFIEKKHTGTTGSPTEITDTAANRANVIKNLSNAAGIAFDEVAAHLKYNNGSAIVELVDSSDVEVAAVDDVTIEFSGGAIQVKDDGINEDKIVSTALDTDYLDGGSGDVLTLSADGQAAVDAIAALPTANVAAPAIWNDAGVLKVGTA